MRLDQEPDPTIITNNSRSHVLWAHCVPGLVDTETGKSLLQVEHSGYKRRTGVTESLNDEPHGCCWWLVAMGQGP